MDVLLDSDNDSFDQSKNLHEFIRNSGSSGLETRERFGKVEIRRRRFRQNSEVYFETGEGDQRGQVVPLRSVSNFATDATKSGDGKTIRRRKRRKARSREVDPELDTEQEHSPTTRIYHKDNNEPGVNVEQERKLPPRDTEFNKYLLLFSVIERYQNPKTSISILFQIKDFFLNFSFFIAITFLLYGSSNQLGNYYSNIVSEVIIESKFKVINAAPTSFRDIRRDTEIWPFLDHVLLKTLYENNSSLGKVLNENVLIGRPRMRQVRVKSQTCLTAGLFESFFTSCYDYYHNAIEDKEPFGLKSAPWTYKGAQDMEKSKGKIATYDSGGFMYEFDQNLDLTKKMINELEKNAWVRLGTGAVFLDLSLYSPNADKFSALKLIFEILPTGGITTSWKVEVFRYFVHHDDRNHVVVLGSEFFSGICLLYYTVELVQKLYYKKYKFFTSWWNIVDVLVVVSGYTMMFYCYSSLIERRSIASRLTNLLNSKNHVSFDYIARIQDHYITTRCLVVLLVIARTFKFTIIRPITMVTLTIFCIKGELLVLVILHIAFIMGFAVLGNILFGIGAVQFRTLWESFYTLYCLFIGGLNFIVDCERQDPSWTKFFFGVYIFTCLAIFFNAYIALIIVGYQRALLRIEYLDEVAYFEELCEDWIYTCLNLCISKRLFKNFHRRRIGKKQRKDREAMVPMLRRHDFRGLHLALILKKHEQGSGWPEKSYDEDKIYSEIHLRNQLLMEVEEHEKISQQLEKAVKSLDFMDQNLSDITSKVDYLVNKVINKRRFF